MKSRLKKDKQKNEIICRLSSQFTANKFFKPFILILINNKNNIIIFV